MYLFLNFSKLDFEGYAIFLLGTLVGWTILLAKESLEESLLREPRSAAHDYWFPRRTPSDDPEDKSRWERFKDWCSRNKVYIGVGILATVAVVTAFVVYSSGSTPPEAPPANSGDNIPEWKQKAGLDRLGWVDSSIGYFEKKTASQVCREFLTNTSFISPGLPRNNLTGADILAKEGMFLKQMIVVLEYYEANPPTEENIKKGLQIITNFLRHGIYILNDLDQLQFYNLNAMEECLNNYGHYLANLSDSPLEFKKLFYFLTQSEVQGPHREALKAFRDIRVDFMVKNLFNV